MPLFIPFTLSYLVIDSGVLCDVIMGYDYGIVKCEADSAIVASKVPLLELTQLRMGMVNGDLVLLFEEQPYSCAVRFASPSAVIVLEYGLL